VVGIGGGVNYSTLGATHNALEDVGLAAGLPNMQVIAPCDPAEVRAATLWCTQENEGPVYLRLGKAGEPDLTRDAVEPWQFGRLRYLRRGRDICLLSYGSVTRMALAVADGLAAQGKSVSVASVHTLKPLDGTRLAEALATHGRVVVIEETLPGTGLAARVKQLAWDEKASCRIDAFTLKDEFVHCYGSHDEVLNAHGLSAGSILAALGG